MYDVTMELKSVDGMLHHRKVIYDSVRKDTVGTPKGLIPSLEIHKGARYETWRFADEYNRDVVYNLMKAPSSVHIPAELFYSDYVDEEVLAPFHIGYLKRALGLARKLSSKSIYRLDATDRLTSHDIKVLFKGKGILKLNVDLVSLGKMWGTTLCTPRCVLDAGISPFTFYKHLLK